MFVSSNAFNGLRSSTSSLNSLGWFGSALLSSLEAKSMRPVGTQSRFTTPLTSLLNELFPPAKLAITVSGLGIAHSFSIREAKHRILTGGPGYGPRWCCPALTATDVRGYPGETPQPFIQPIIIQHVPLSQPPRLEIRNRFFARHCITFVVD